MPKNKTWCPNQGHAESCQIYFSSKNLCIITVIIYFVSLDLANCSTPRLYNAHASIISPESPALKIKKKKRVKYSKYHSNRNCA